MNFPHHITIIHGALAPDGGSIFLDALDEHSRPLKIFLDWSDDAQHYGSTWLSTDGVIVPKRSVEEAKWLELIASARIVPENAASYSPAERDGIAASLAIFRDDLIAKVRSSTYERKGPAPTE